MKILLVEDHVDNASLIQDIVEFDLSGVELVWVTTAEEALKIAAGLQPALILMDLRLPGMDGLEAIRRLRSDAATAEIPIWAVTASAMVGDEKLALTIGAQAYITKPIQSKALAQRLREALIPDSFRTNPSSAPLPKETSACPKS
jgi:two-component system, cell cycle response regulator DivK